MSFSIESLKNKLDALDESQDSIVSTSQWVLFYYRNAPKIVEVWKTYLEKASQKKKLPLIYLANDVVQQARSKKRPEFIDAFAEVLPIALVNCYNSVPEPIKKKILKIVKIWKDRHIFPTNIDIDGITDNPSPSSQIHSKSKSNALASESFETLSNDEKLKVLEATSKKFETFFQNILIEARGSYTEQNFTDLKGLVDVVEETILELTDLKKNVTKEVTSAKERSEALKQKKIELEEKQKEIEEQKRLQEKRILDALRKKKEEDEMLPTYENADSDDSDNSSEAENEEQDKESSNEINDDSTEEPITKKARFSD